MAERCCLLMCKNPSRTQCHCCKKNFCRSHFNEHDNLPNLQLDSLADEVNLLNDRLTEFNVEKLIGDSRLKLERWRVNCHKMIDDIFEEKYREIDQRANEKLAQQRDGMTKMRSTIAERIRQQETTMKDIELLKATIGKAEQEINNLKYTCFDVVVRPFVIDDSLIRIEELHIPEFELSSLSQPCQTINHTNGSSLLIASNDEFVLMHQKPNLCLMNQDLTIVRRSPWDYGVIYDICWSTALARFLVITRRNVFMVNDGTMAVELIQINQKQKWCSGTCFDTSLYLSTDNIGSSILKFRLSPTIQLEKEWKSPETCASDQGIMNVVCKNETLALTILDVCKKEKLIELRSSRTLERLWSLRLDVEYSDTIFRCCSINHDNWFVWDYNTLSLLHISNDGKVQGTSTYHEKPCHVILFHRNELIISTKDSINCHKLKVIN